MDILIVMWTAIPFFFVNLRKHKGMPGAIKYIIDDNGQKTTVLVSIKDWDTLNTNYRKLQKKVEVFTSIRNGLKEVRQAKKTGRKLPSLKELLK
jgi:hypothetical protein